MKYLDRKSNEIRVENYSRMPYVDYMLALVALAVIWTGTAWQLTDGNAVDVARSASHFNDFFWIVFGAASSSIDHKHSETWMSNIKGEG